MMVIRNMKRNKNDKIREYAKAEAEHFMDVQRLSNYGSDCENMSFSNIRTDTCDQKYTRTGNGSRKKP